MQSSNNQLVLEKVLIPAIALFVLSYGAIAGLGLLVDWSDNLGNRTVWLSGLIPLICIAIAIAFQSIYQQRKYYQQFAQQLVRRFARASWSEKLFVICTLLIIGANGLACCLFYPYNVDSVTHLVPRALYYIQNNGSDFFEANYWAQVTHPVYGAYLNIAFLMLLVDERAVNLVQFVASLFGALAIMGSALAIGDLFWPSLLAGCIFLNLTMVNLQMTTNQLDLLMASLLACSVFFGILWSQRRSTCLAFLAVLSYALPLGIKSSALLYGPSLLILLVAYVWRSRSLKNLATFLAIFSVGICLVFFTAGYWRNLQIFGDPIGSDIPYALHSVRGAPILTVLQSGVANMVRYSSQFLSLDGLPPLDFIHALHSAMQRLFVYPYRLLGIDVGTPSLGGRPFLIDRPYAHEDVSNWGVLGLAIVPAIAAAFRPSKRAFLPLSLSFIVFLIVQSFLAQYDPWRGRYFIAGAVFAVPLVVQWWQAIAPATVWSRLLSWLLAALLLAGSASAVTTLLWRDNRPFLDVNYPDIQQPAVWRLNRLEQMVAGDRSLAASLQAIAEWLDAQPEQTLYLALPPNFPEYALFRDHRLVPLNSFLSGFKASSLADLDGGLLLYHSDVYAQQRPNDIRFGNQLYGRMLSAAEGESPDFDPE